MPSLMAACASFGSFLNASAKLSRGAFGKLLAHLRHAAIVQPHGFGIVAILRTCESGYNSQKQKHTNSDFFHRD